MNLNLLANKIFKILLPAIVGCSSLAIATPFLVSCSQAKQEKIYREYWLIKKDENNYYMLFQFMPASWGKYPEYIYLGTKENVEKYIKMWYKPDVKIIDKTKEFVI